MGYLLVAKLVNSASIPRFASSSVEANMAHFETGAYLNVKEGMPFEDFRPPNWERWTEGAVQWGAKELLRVTQPHGRLQMWMLNEENLRWFDQTSQKNMSYSNQNINTYDFDDFAYGSTWDQNGIQYLRISG